MRTLLAAPGDEPVEALMDTAFTAVTMDEDQQEAARLVRKYDLISLPVTDGEGRLVGAIGRQQHRGRHRGGGHGGLRAQWPRWCPARDGYAASSVWVAGLAPAAVAADPHGLGGIVRQAHTAL